MTFKRAGHFEKVNPQGTMNDLLIDHLKKVGDITALEAQSLYKVRSLSRRIVDIKKRGYSILSVPKIDHAGQRYVRYVYRGKTDGREVIDTAFAT